MSSPKAFAVSACYLNESGLGNEPALSAATEMRHVITAHEGLNPSPMRVLACTDFREQTTFGPSPELLAKRVAEVNRPDGKIVFVGPESEPLSGPPGVLAVVVLGAIVTGVVLLYFFLKSL